MSDRPRILVVCATEWERAAIADRTLQSQYDFVRCGDEVYDSVNLWNAIRFDVERYLHGIIASQKHNRIDGVLGTGDYPGCMFGAYIAEHLYLPSPRARDTVLLSHKYYSRRLQRRVAPEATPPFAILDPLPLRPPPPLSYPFFVKPVKGTMSIRAQMVHDGWQLRRALSLPLRERLRGFVLLRPFAQLLSLYECDPVPAHAFIAEAPLSGLQVTVDGFVQDGRATIMGVVDSVMYPGTSSFRRFEYPSTLPDDVQARMAELVTRLMEGIGFDHSCFNVELFYDAQSDKLSIIEINPRMSYQFSDLFARVDGMSSFAVQLQLSTGQKVRWPRKQGPCAVAASFVMRRFSDARVLAVPQPQHLSAIERRYPGSQVQVLCDIGDRLSDHAQDMNSFRYCIVNLAAPDRATLYARFVDVEQALPFSFT